MFVAVWAGALADSISHLRGWSEPGGQSHGHCTMHRHTRTARPRRQPGDHGGAQERHGCAHGSELAKTI